MYIPPLRHLYELVVPHHKRHIGQELDERHISDLPYELQIEILTKLFASQTYSQNKTLVGNDHFPQYKKTLENMLQKAMSATLREDSDLNLYDRDGVNSIIWLLYYKDGGLNSECLRHSKRVDSNLFRPCQQVHAN